MALRHRLSAVLPLLHIKLVDFSDKSDNRYHYIVFCNLLSGLMSQHLRTQDPDRWVELAMDPWAEAHPASDHKGQRASRAIYMPGLLFICSPVFGFYDLNPKSKIGNLKLTYRRSR